MEIAQTILLGLILVTLIVTLWHNNRESALPWEYKKVREDNRYL